MYSIWSILVAAIVAFVLGWIWYSDFVFGKKWRQLSGISEEYHREMAQDKKRMMKSMGTYLVSLILMAFVLARFLAFLGAYGVSDGLTYGFWIWLGFVVPSMLGMVLWERKTWSYYFINVFYQLVALLAMGAVLMLAR